MRKPDIPARAVEVRQEQEGDAPAIRRVHELAFGQTDEADIVERLRRSPSWLPELSLVAVAGGEVVGHVLLSRAALDSGTEVLALAPMGVVPEYQRRGIGSVLVDRALSRAAKTDFPLVVVVGHPGYYPRFGFEPADQYDITPPFEVPREAWMVYRLPSFQSERVRGRVLYPPAFGLT
ncbi:MAG: N-acetyltransferase [Actinomycetota bacterium]|nr:N-acetyltransferase [Actinomycetota bacterium]